MTEDYSSAAIRHFKDGELLEGNRRLPNADQLFGFAAECAIKSALVGVPCCAQGGTLAGRYWQHINVLWDRAQLQGIQKCYPKLVAVLAGLRQPFEGWSTDQRYGPDDAVTAEALDLHHRAAARILGSVGLSGTRREA